ncbi:hypothetical protein V494_01046 [Pseudogymnoascus sp. VKM F-4513 (FW-928)]|nr:hypothetical protein V494_01046 [Pseudogymnoascus sp. VKM F-4513 (FW-928)]
MSYESPPIVRPVPRRPFDINLTSATPPSGSEASTPSVRPSSPNHLDAKSGSGHGNSGSETPSLNPTRSILNLTSSTLFGIYSPSFTEKMVDNEPGTPFGTGAMTPLSPAASRPRTRSPHVVPHTPLHLQIIGLTLRSALLFLLGTAYGLLVTHLHNEQRLAPFGSQGFIQPSYDKKYLLFWGVAGVAMGSALPWFDGMWEDYFGEEITNSAVGGKVIDGKNEEEGVAAQWTPVVRSIGAFFGIAFAIRKLAWTSTLQASLTLALVNPFLWYLLDRSKPGFVLSVTVGLIGTTGLLMFDSTMVQSPLATHSSYNSTSGSGHPSIYAQGDNTELFGSAVWIMSVLFCSVLCFGHIGRRLALLRRKSRAAALQNN